MNNPVRAGAVILLLLSWNLAHLRADDAEDKAVKAIEALGGQIDRGGQDKGPIVSIHLIGTNTTDADLKILKNFKDLRSLYLGRTQITDAGLKDLKELKGLTFLGLRQTQVTAQGVKDLQDALPQCDIASTLGAAGRGGRVGAAGRGGRVGAAGRGGRVGAAGRGGRAGVPMLPGVEENAQLPTEFSAQILKITPRSIAFNVAGQRGRGFRNTMTLPVADDVKVFLARAERGQRTPDKDQEVSEGLRNAKLKAAFASGSYSLSGRITTDKAGEKIKEVHVVIPEPLPTISPMPLKPTSAPAGVPDPDALPPHAVARLGSLRFRHGLFGAGSGEQSHARVAISPDGQFLATCTSDSVQLWNPLTGERVTKLDLDNAGIDNPITIAGNQELAFSADGTCLAISRGAGKLRILTNMGRASKELDFSSRDRNRGIMQANSFMGPDMMARGGGRGYAGPTSSFVAFLPDAKQVLVNHHNGPLLRLFSVESGIEIRTFGSNDRLPSAIALSPDGQWLAVAEGTDGKVTIFEVATGATHLQLNEDSGPCTALAFSSDSKVIATASLEIHLWNAASGKALRSLDSSAIPGHAPPGANKVNNGQAARRYGSTVVVSLQFSPDGKQVLAGYRSWVVLWDAASGKEIRHFEDPCAATVRFMPNGKELLVVAPGAFRFLDAASGKPIRLYEGHESAIHSIAFAPDGKQLATGTIDDGVRIWETASRKARLASDNQTTMVNSLAYSPRGDCLVGALGSDIVVWDPRTGAQRLRLAAHLEGGPRRSPDLAISSDGTKLAYATSFGWACLANLADGTELQDLHLGDGPVGTMAFSPDLHFVAAPHARLAGQMPREAPLEIWDFQARKHLKSITTPFGGSSHLTFSPDGRTLIDVTNVRTQEGPQTYALEILSGQQRFSIIEGGSGPLWGQIHAVAFSPDGRRLALAENMSAAPMMVRQAPKEQPKQSIRVIDLTTGRWAVPLTGHEGDINALAFSPDGKLLASGSSDTTALLWNVDELFPPAPVAPLSADVRLACWNDLGGEAKAAYRSMWKLASDPNTIDLFRKELKPATTLESKQGSQFQSMRAIEVLEWMNTNATRELLTAIAGGLPGAALTQEAARSLARLKSMKP
ncbi:MAG TPA: hypothetical protein VGP68_01405 [Gemmataceae bacterium]|nr:hypothetical protein [Gemmataceae bacterium]